MGCECACVHTCSVYVLVYTEMHCALIKTAEEKLKKILYAFNVGPSQEAVTYRVFFLQSVSENYKHTPVHQTKSGLHMQLRHKVQPTDVKQKKIVGTKKLLLGCKPGQRRVNWPEDQAFQGLTVCFTGFAPLNVCKYVKCALFNGCQSNVRHGRLVVDKHDTNTPQKPWWTTETDLL